MKPRLCVSISAQDSNQRYTIMNAVGRVIVLIVLLICGATTAFAQAMPNPSIAVLDIQRILRESLAAKSVRPQADKIRGKYQKEVRNQESQLRKAEQDLARQRAILSPEAYAQKRRKFDRCRGGSGNSTRHSAAPWKKSAALWLRLQRKSPPNAKSIWFCPSRWCCCR